jgi:hypothetical protein
VFGKRRVRVKYLRAPGISKGGTGIKEPPVPGIEKDPSQRTVGFHSFKPLEEPHWGFIKKRTGIAFFCAVI